MTKVIIFLLNILSILHPQKYLSFETLYILSVKDNYSLCFLARNGE